MERARRSMVARGWRRKRDGQADHRGSGGVKPFCMDQGGGDRSFYVCQNPKYHTES